MQGPSFLSKTHCWFEEEEKGLKFRAFAKYCPVRGDYARRQQTRLTCGFELLAAAFWWHPLPARSFLHYKCHCLFFCQDRNMLRIRDSFVYGRVERWWEKRMSAKRVRRPIRFWAGLRQREPFGTCSIWTNNRSFLLKIASWPQHKNIAPQIGKGLYMTVPGCTWLY